jgi:acyl-CoA synthetase (AMP-forming)/AMP-acid ligase II
MLLAAAGPEPAVIDGDAVVTYAELASMALGTAETVAELGVEPGDRVAILARRGAGAAAAYYGVLAAGAVAVIVNELLKPRQVEYVLDHSGATVLLVEGAILERLPRPLATEATVVVRDQLGGSSGFEPVPRLRDDVAQIVYTSGSTGRPKGVTLSQGNLWAGTQSVVSYLGLTGQDRIASLLPFSFDYGLNQLQCAVATGGALVVERSPVAARIVRTLREQEVSVLAGVPPLWLQLLQVDAFRDEPLPTLRRMTNSGGKLPVESVRLLRKCQPQAELYLMYGLTEAFRSTYLAPDRVDAKPGAIGQAIPGAEVFVVDGDGLPCAPRQVGELVHRGPTVALGYWRDPEATARVYRPNPLRQWAELNRERVVYSGDLAYRDEDGDLFFVGREDALIKTLGYRVSPDEVVDVLYASGEIVEGVVSSEPDEVRGQRIVAHVVLAEHGELERLKAFVAKELPRFMQPSRIELRPDIERTVSGKYDAAATAHRDS